MADGAEPRVAMLGAIVLVPVLFLWRRMKTA